MSRMTSVTVGENPRNSIAGGGEAEFSDSEELGTVGRKQNLTLFVCRSYPLDVVVGC